MIGKSCLAVMSVGIVSVALAHAGAQESDVEIAEAVKAHDSYFQSLRSWEGVGDLKEVFTVDRKVLDTPDLKPEPVRIERLSKVRFAWDASLRSVRAISSCVPPTKLFQTDSETEIVEDLQINCLIRPDGFYRFEPNLAFSDFKGYPQFGKVTRVLEKRSLRDSARARTYSYLFDPETVFEIHGHRIDSRLKALPSKIEKGTASLESSGSTVKIVERYKNAEGPEFRVEIDLDRTKGYLPVRCSAFTGDDVAETSEWEYADVDGVMLPARRDVKKFNNGVFSSSRSISINESKVNQAYTEDDFSFASIGVEDDDRMIDREVKKMYVLEDGKQHEVAATPPAQLRWRWLVGANVLAIVFLIVAFRWRARKA